MIKIKATSVKSGGFSKMKEPYLITKKLGVIAAVLVPVTLPANATKDEVKSAVLEAVKSWGNYGQEQSRIP